ncbi:MAG: TolC family protein [Chitinophagales bacterium]
MNYAFSFSAFSGKLFLLVAGLSISINSKAQTPILLSLEQCYALAKQNYPLIKQRDLIEKSRDYTINNIGTGYLPQWTSSGQLTYQSDVTQLPFKNIPGIPGLDVPLIPKTQYKIYGEIDQNIYDGGIMKWQKQVERSNADIQDQNLEVELYTLKDRVNQVYFGILLINEQLKQNELQQQDLQFVVNATQVAVDNGAGFRRSLNEARVELLKSQQNNIDLRSTKRSYLLMLALLIHVSLDESTVFQTPSDVIPSSVINRPELKLYDNQKKLYDVQEKQLSVNLLPKVSAFVQGGYAQPPLNFLNANPAFYYIGGFRFNWPLTSLYTHKNEKRILELNRNNQDVQKETFVFNTNQTLVQESNEISKLRQLIDKDKEIIELRASIKNSGKEQAQNGVITVHDYLTYVNDENRARQDLVLHQVQLLFTQYNHKTASGN